MMVQVLILLVGFFSAGKGSGLVCGGATSIAKKAWNPAACNRTYNSCYGNEFRSSCKHYGSIRQ